MRFNLRETLGLESEAPNVEINFNIDNDDDSEETPIDTEDEVETADVTAEHDEVDDAKTEAIEAQAEEERSEADVEELEEAQEALESLKLIVSKHHKLSMEEFEMFQLVTRNVTKQKSYLETLSSETFIQSDYHRKLIAEELLNASLENLEVVSLEAKESLWERVKNKFARFQDLERAIVRKANALKELASESGHEKADIEYIKFDDKNTPKFKQLRSNAVNEFRELMNNAKTADTFFSNLKSNNYLLQYLLYSILLIRCKKLKIKIPRHSV